jgi:sec-independent protein translocase protein TatA
MWPIFKIKIPCCGLTFKQLNFVAIKMKFSKELLYLYALILSIMIISSFLASVFLLGLPGGSEWIVIILVALLFFGGKKIPELMRGIGKGMREFKDAKDNIKNEIEEGMKEKDKDEELRELRRQLQEKQAQELPK